MMLPIIWYTLCLLGLATQIFLIVLRKYSNNIFWRYWLLLDKHGGTSMVNAVLHLSIHSLMFSGLLTSTSTLRFYILPSRWLLLLCPLQTRFMNSLLFLKIAFWIANMYGGAPILSLPSVVSKSQLGFNVGHNFYFWIIMQIHCLFGGLLGWNCFPFFLIYNEKHNN